MKTVTMSIEELRRAQYVFEECRKISRILHRLDETACNYGLTPTQEKRVKKLETAAEELAQRLSLHAYHQGDPRGASLYLINDTLNDTNYSNGVCLY